MLFIIVQSIQVGLGLDVWISGTTTLFQMVVEGIKLDFKEDPENGERSFFLFGRIPADRVLQEITELFSSSSLFRNSSVSSAGVVYASDDFKDPGSTMVGSIAPFVGGVVEGGTHLGCELSNVSQLATLVNGGGTSFFLQLTSSSKRGEIKAKLSGLQGKYLTLGDETNFEVGPLEPIIEMPSSSSDYPRLTLASTINVPVPGGEILPFLFPLEVGKNRAAGRGGLVGKDAWENAFGLDRLSIKDVCVVCEISYPTLATEGPDMFAVQAGLPFGEDADSPELRLSFPVCSDGADQVILGEVNQAIVASNIEYFLKSHFGLSVSIPDILEFNNIKFCVSNEAKSIDGVDYQPGCSFSGDMQLYGYYGTASMTINSDGMKGEGVVDPFSIGPLSIEGYEGSNPLVYVSVSKEEQVVNVNGAADLFGLLNIGLRLWIRGALDVEFKCQIRVLEDAFLLDIEGFSRTDDEGDLEFALTATFENDLIGWIQRRVLTLFNDFVGAANKAIEEAQAEVDKAKAVYEAEFDKANEYLEAKKGEYNAAINKAKKDFNNEIKKLQAEINAKKKELNRAKSSYTSSIKKKQADLNKAKTSLDSTVASAQKELDSAETSGKKKIADAKKSVSKAEAAFNKAVRDSDAKINSAIKEVQKIQPKIDECSNKIRSLKKKKNWRNAFWVVPEIGWWEGKKKGYEAAKWVAEKALNLAKSVKNAILNGSKKAAVSTANKALAAAEKAWSAGVKAAKSVLSKAQKAGQKLVDAAISALNVAKKAGLKAINLAQRALNLAKKALEEGRKVAQKVLDGVKVAQAAIVSTAQKGLDAVKEGTSFIAFEGAKAILEGVKEVNEGLVKFVEEALKVMENLFYLKKVTLATEVTWGSRDAISFRAAVEIVVFGDEKKLELEWKIVEPMSMVENLFKEMKSVASLKALT